MRFSLVVLPLPCQLCLRLLETGNTVASKYIGSTYPASRRELALIAHADNIRYQLGDFLEWNDQRELTDFHPYFTTLTSAKSPVIIRRTPSLTIEELEAAKARRHGRVAFP